MADADAKIEKGKVRLQVADARREESGRGFRFNYGQIVAILSILTEKQQLSAVAAAGGTSSGSKVPASFILQELPQAADSIYAAPVIGDQGRPQSDEEPGRVGLAK